MLAALTEEMGELVQALLQKKPKKEILAEAKQVACVAIRLMEEGDGDFEQTLHEQVLEFHKAMNLPYSINPTIPAEDRIRLRLNLVTEEYFEFLESVFGTEYFLRYIDVFKDKIMYENNYTNS